MLDRDGLGAGLPVRLDIARELGAAFLLVVPPRVAPADLDRTVAAMRDGLVIASSAAEAVGVRIAFEFLGFGDCPINTPALAARVVDGLEAIGLVLDSCHWHASGAPDLAGLPVHRIEMVHLNDAPAKPPRTIEDDDRVLPGDGVIDLPRLIRMLDEAGYRGPFSLETFNPGYWEDAALDVANRGRARLDRLLADRD